MRAKIIFVFVAMCLSSTLYSQGIDKAKMDQDLEIAKTVLQSLMSRGDNYLLWGRNMEANYMEGFGVIFTLPDDYVYSFSRDAVIAGTGRRDRSEAVVAPSPAQEKANQEKDEQEKKTREAVTTFLVDYSDLIGQLKPEDKIMVHARSRDDIYVNVIGSSDATWSVEGGQGSFSAEVSKKDISEFKQGKISRDEAVKRIHFVENEPVEREQDLELFASILKRMYSSDLSKTFFVSRSPSYERLSGFGVIFNMTTYSSFENDNFYRMPVLGRDDVSSDERKETIETLYPKFEEELKNALIEYGRTIRSLGEDELIMLKVKSTRCDGCNIPKSMELSVKKSVLTQYDQRKISLAEAIKAIKVQKQFDS